MSTLLRILLLFPLSTCSVCVCKPLAEGEEEEGGGGEREAREADSPPVEIKEEERVEIFAARQRLSENQEIFLYNPEDCIEENLN